MHELKVGADGNDDAVEEVAVTARDQLMAVSKIVIGSEGLLSVAEEMRNVLRDYRTGSPSSEEAE